jgi:hypothetical protein
MSILKNIFSPDYKQLLTYRTATALAKNHEYDGNLLTDEFFTFFINNYDEIISDIKSAKGMKVRIPISDSGQLFSFSQILPILYDRVVFSPAPMHLSGLCSWPEFSQNSLGLFPVNVSGQIYEIINWMGTAKELIADGAVMFLPQHGSDPTWWDYDKFHLPKFPRPYSDKSLPHTRETIVEESFYQLLVDTFVSKQIGCDHYLYSLGKSNIALNDIWLNADKDEALKRYFFLELKIPFIKNIELNDLSKIRQDEYKYFEAFRNSINTTFREIVRVADNSSRPELIVNSLKKEIVDEPLLKLENRLGKMVKKYSSSLSGCGLASTQLILCSVAGGGLFNLPAPTVGSVNCLDIYRTFLEFLEDHVELESDSLYYHIRNIHRDEDKRPT